MSHSLYIPLAYPISDIQSAYPPGGSNDPHDPVSIEPFSGCAPAKGVAFPEGVRDVIILREGKRRIIVPSNSVWDDVFTAPGVDLGERPQTEVQVREDF